MKNKVCKLRGKTVLSCKVSRKKNFLRPHYNHNQNNNREGVRQMAAKKPAKKAPAKKKAGKKK
jgi:hypothetical protein